LQHLHYQMFFPDYHWRRHLRTRCLLYCRHRRQKPLCLPSRRDHQKHHPNHRCHYCRRLTRPRQYQLMCLLLRRLLVLYYPLVSSYLASIPSITDLTFSFITFSFLDSSFCTANCCSIVSPFDCSPVVSDSILVHLSISLSR